MAKSIRITVVESEIHPVTGDIKKRTKVFFVDKPELSELLQRNDMYYSQTVVTEVYED